MPEVKRCQSFLSVNYTRLNPCRNISALDHCNCMRTDGPTRDVRGGNKELWRRFRHPGHIHVYRAAIAAPDAVINIIKGAGNKELWYFILHSQARRPGQARLREREVDQKRSWHSDAALASSFRPCTGGWLFLDSVTREGTAVMLGGSSEHRDFLRKRIRTEYRVMHERNSPFSATVRIICDL